MESGRRRRAVLAWALGGAAVLVVGGIAIGVTVLNAQRTPVAVAEQYLSHIAAGDADAANALSVRGGDDAELLTDEVLDAATERISEIEVTLRENGSRRASVDVRFQLAGEEHTGILRLQAGDPEWGLLTNWKVWKPFGDATAVSVVGPTGLRVAGHPVELSKGEIVREALLTMYPGVYPLEADDTRYFDLEDDSVMVTMKQFQVQQLEFLPTKRLVDAVTRETGALLDACAAQTSPRPEGCPLLAGSDAGEGPVTWEVLRAPRVTIQADGRSFRADAEVRQTFTMEGEASPVVYEEEIGFSGTFEIVGDTVSVLYDAGS